MNQVKKEVMIVLELVLVVILLVVTGCAKDSNSFSFGIKGIGSTTNTFELATNEPTGPRYFDWHSINVASDSHHAGIDYIGKLDSPIKAFGSGRIMSILSGENRGLGNTISIAHRLPDGSTIYSQYSHLNSFNKEMYQGMYVPKGTVIGYMGKTGSGSGNVIHLHFEVKNSNSIGHNPNCVVVGCVGYVNPKFLPVTSRGYYNPNEFINLREYKDLTGSELKLESTKKTDFRVTMVLDNPFSASTNVDIRLALYTTDETYKGDIQSFNKEFNGNTCNLVKFSKVNLTSPIGKYKIQVEYKATNSATSNWKPLPFKGSNSVNINLI